MLGRRSLFSRRRAVAALRSFREPAVPSRVHNRVPYVEAPADKVPGEHKNTESRPFTSLKVRAKTVLVWLQIDMSQTVFFLRVMVYFIKH